jgi:hypothetical protein
MRCVIFLLLLIPSIARADVCSSACSSRSFETEHIYSKVLIALTVDLIRNPDFEDPKLDNIDFILYPPAIQVKGKITSKVDIPTMGTRKIRIGSVATVGLWKADIAWRLIGRQGPVTCASGVVDIINLPGKTKLKVKVRLKTKTRLPNGPIIRAIAQQRARDGAHDTTCELKRMIHKALDLWKHPLLSKI